MAGQWRETCHVLAETVKYYTLGGRRVAMRKADTLYYLFSDHLGSTSVVYDTSSGTWVMQRYAPYGRVRSGGTNALPTDYTFTGQRVDEAIGLMDYGARWYDPTIGRFVQADPIVPQPANPQALNRYSYVLNNPLKYVDPSGRIPTCTNGPCAARRAGGPAPGPEPQEEESTWLKNALKTNAASSEVVQWRAENAVGNVLLTFVFATKDNRAVSKLRRGALGWTALMKGDAYVGWTLKVRPKGPWDFEDFVRRQFGKGLQKEAITIGGEEYRFDILANIHYGFVGKAAGFTDLELLSGAGVAQIWAGMSEWSFWQTYFDDPVDQIAILMGIELYETYGLSFTEEQFMEIFNKYASELARPDESNWAYER